jgi:hypothetical protein
MLDLLINVPSLVMAEIAWYLRCILIAALCFAAGLAVTIEVAGTYLLRAQRRRSRILTHRTNATLGKVNL